MQANRWRTQTTEDAGEHSTQEVLSRTDTVGRAMSKLEQVNRLLPSKEKVISIAQEIDVEDFPYFRWARFCRVLPNEHGKEMGK